MHPVMHIDRIAVSHHAARFTVHLDRHAGPLGPPIELERAFPNRLAAIFTLMDAVVSHVEERYGVDGERVTMGEK